MLGVGRVVEVAVERGAGGEDREREREHRAAGRAEAAEEIGEGGAAGAGHAAGETGERRDYGRVVKEPVA